MSVSAFLLKEVIPLVKAIVFTYFTIFKDQLISDSYSFHTVYKPSILR